MVLFSSISRLLFSFSAFYLVSTDAAASLRVNKSCFAVNENIAISFQNDSPRSDDWVGFYGTSTSLSSVPSPSGDRWLWTCGSTSCTSSQGISRSTITFTSFLPVGTWKVILTRDDDGGSPYVGVAQSTSFVVSNSCSPASPSARVPTRRPTVAPARTANTAAAFTAARSEIESLIIGSRGNQRLAAMFLRLGFHDCVGGCDGCVDLTNPDNNGLLVPVQALRNVVSRHANSVTKITRADIWALATAVGADVLQTRVRVDFDLLTVGRINCENANTVCRNENGAQQPCSDVRGPHRALPGMNTNSRELFTFFADEFNFSVKDTVAIMGAHTIGVLRKSEVGVDGPNGWLPDNNVFDNGK